MSIISPTVFVLAGGMGTRLSSILGSCPKPMAPGAGLPFLEYLLNWLHTQGILKVVILTDHKSSSIQKYFSNGYWHGLEIRYIYEEQPLGTGGAVVNALNYLGWDGPFILINGDSFVDVKILSFYQNMLNEQAGVVLSHQSNVSRYGVIETDCDGYIISFKEKSKNSVGLVNAGIYYFRAEIFDRFSHGNISLEQEVFPALIENNIAVKGYVCNGYFLDIGTPDSYQQYQRYMRGKERLFDYA